MNNTPVVVIFIPIMQALATRLGQAPSRLMMPLSFAAILGGMTTLIGSSTNLLVSGMLVELREPGLSFFQFTIPGLVVAFVGMRSEEHTSELQSLMRISYAVFCLTKKKTTNK